MTLCPLCGHPESWGHRCGGSTPPTEDAVQRWREAGGTVPDQPMVSRKDAKRSDRQRKLDAVLNVALEAGRVAEDVRLVAENPLHLPGRVGGIGSLATSVELLSAAVAGLARAAMTE